MALLGSGEFEPWTDQVDGWLLERARGDGSVLILPTASAPEGDDVFDRWGNKGLAHYRELGVRADVLPLKESSDADLTAIVRRAEQASVVYFSGGNPAYLASTLRGSAFWRVVLQRLPEGLGYVGCSAGVAVLGEMAPDNTVRDPLSEDPWRPGLGLFPRTYFGPHWDALNRYVPGLRESIIDSVPDGSRLLAIDENTAVLGDGLDWTVVGAGSASLLEREWREFASGSSFTEDFRRAA